MSKRKTEARKKGGTHSSEPRPTPPTPTVSPLIAREPEAAAVVGLSKQTLRVLRSRGGGPRFVKLGPRRIGYLLTDLEVWARSRPGFVNTTEASLASAVEAPSTDRRAAR
jgi:predicted DNA-binding transcriptional regulator AlpA